MNGQGTMLDDASTDATGRSGQGMLQSEQEWDLRNEILVDTLSGLIWEYAPDAHGRAIDVGCQHGTLTDMLAQRTELSWTGIDPTIESASRSPGGAELVNGVAHELPAGDGELSCVFFANVYEHIAPERRRASIAELYRTLKPGGVVAGQLPIPYFPIESHSRLPFMGWLPLRAQKAYWRLAPVPWEHDFYVVTIKHVRRDAEAVGFEI